MIWIGCYLIGVVVCIVLFYDEDDGLWPIAWAFVWPISIVIAAFGMLTGAISLALDQEDPPDEQ